jgi:Uma2 family endonuclease
MATTAVTIEEYLSTSYRPDCDYVDGEIQERNLGEYDHARLQAAILAYLYNRRKEWGITVVPEQRVQVASSRFRILDVCVVLGKPDGQVFRKPPFICIEILSPEDRVFRTKQRIDDYLKFGVPYVFLIDPQTRTATRYILGGSSEVTELRTEDPEIIVPVADLFED